MDELYESLEWPTSPGANKALGRTSMAEKGQELPDAWDGTYLGPEIPEPGAGRTDWGQGGSQGPTASHEPA